MVGTQRVVETPRPDFEPVVSDGVDGVVEHHRELKILLVMSWPVGVFTQVEFEMDRGWPASALDVDSARRVTGEDASGDLAGRTQWQRTVVRGVSVVRRSSAQLRVEPCGLSHEVVAFGEAGR
jgi:hypothetical protein